MGIKAVVLGTGRMGRAAAWDLARQSGVDLIRLVDRDQESLRLAQQDLQRLLGSGGGAGAATESETQCMELTDEDQLQPLLNGFDVVLSAADYRINRAATRAAIATKTHLCDLGGNITVVQQQLAMHHDAQRAGITVIPDCGLAPGMAGLLAASGVDQFDTATEVSIRVGGLPAHPKPPLNYKVVFSARGLINEYLEPTEVLRDGRIQQVASLTELESIEFPPPFGTLEAFNTSGGASTLPHTLQDRVRDLTYKTLRYPGHCAVFAGMQSLGLLSAAPVLGVSPRALTEQLIEQSLRDDDTDVVLLRVTVVGRKDGRSVRLVYQLIDQHDPATGHSAMARGTAYPAAAIAAMLARGEIERHGVLPGESAVPLDAFLAAVRARGLNVTERWEPLECRSP